MTESTSREKLRAGAGHVSMGVRGGEALWQVRVCWPAEGPAHLSGDDVDAESRVVRPGILIPPSAPALDRPLFCQGQMREREVLHRKNLLEMPVFLPCGDPCQADVGLKAQLWPPRALVDQEVEAPLPG